jgi:hypothetical protein
MEERAAETDRTIPKSVLGVFRFFVSYFEIHPAATANKLGKPVLHRGRILVRIPSGIAMKCRSSKLFFSVNGSEPPETSMHRQARRTLLQDL